HLREGRDSSAWQDAVALAERLVESVEIPVRETLEQRRRLNEQVCEGLCDGLRLIGEEQPEDSPQLHQLQALQQAALATMAPPALAAVEPRAPPVVGPVESSVMVEPVSAPISDVESVPAAEPGQPELAVDIPLLTDMVLVEEPVLEEPLPESQPETVAELPDAEAAAWVASLHTG